MKESYGQVDNLYEQVFRAGQSIIQNYFQNYSGYQHDIRDMAISFSQFASKAIIDRNEALKVKSNYLEYLEKQQRLWEAILEKNGSYVPVISPSPEDKRFRAPEWNDQPFFDFIKQSYLLLSEFLRKTLHDTELGEREKRKMFFFMNHYIDAFSPSNFAFTNPEVIKIAKESRGESILNGYKNLLKDIEKGRISQTDDNAFEVGRNLAITPGSVIFQNELIQLIQYAPKGNRVFENPLLLIPPWINKYYIFDLQPENSFVLYLVDQGFTVFLISWKNPSPEMRNVSFDDYVEKGVLQATEVIQSIARSKVNILGYCLGGTLLGVALAVLKARKNDAVQSATFLAAMLDFTDVGPMGDVIDQALVSKLERGELQRQGVMHGHDMERAFNLIRPNDLIWNYVVNNYLKGNDPAPFDVLYWTNDNTNLPAKMYNFYLRHMILENKLSRKNALRICDTPIDIGSIDLPSFIIATREDHISPAVTVFTNTELLSGPMEFILGDSGHVMGVANPPSRNKYGFRKNGKLGYGFNAWKENAEHVNGSWWPYWVKWLETYSGNKIKAPSKPGNKKYPIIEPAPGFFVKERCSQCFPEYNENSKQ